MRVGLSILTVVSLGIFTPCRASADEVSTSSPPGYVWCALEHYNGRVLIPKGWFCREIATHSGIGYQITDEEVIPKYSDYRTDFGGQHEYWEYWSPDRLPNSDYRTGFMIKVISGPFWNKARLAKLAEGFFEDKKRAGRVSELGDGSVGAYTTRSSDRDGIEVVGKVLESQHFVELMLQDTETPTMVFVTFDCPLSTWPQNKDLCDRFFASLSLFQGVKDPNHSPYPQDLSVATAAAR